jgi:hypothetical protein
MGTLKPAFTVVFASETFDGLRFYANNRVGVGRSFERDREWPLMYGNEPTPEIGPITFCYITRLETYGARTSLAGRVRHATGLQRVFLMNRLVVHAPFSCAAPCDLAAQSHRIVDTTPNAEYAIVQMAQERCERIRVGRLAYLSQPRHS